MVIAVFILNDKYNKKKEMKVRFIFAWYDIWVGAFWDRKKQWLYILPLPMVGVILKFNARQKKTSQKTPGHK